MEMCYDGALVMPSSCALMSEDEMTYVDGGRTKKYYNKAGTLVNTCHLLAMAWKIQDYLYASTITFANKIPSPGTVAAYYCSHNAEMMSKAEDKCRKYKNSTKITLTIQYGLLGWIDSVSTKKGK